jgi:hypothetical protein
MGRPDVITTTLATPRTRPLRRANSAELGWAGSRGLDNRTAGDVKEPGSAVSSSLASDAGGHGLRVLGACEGLVDDADRDFDSGGDGTDGFPALTAGEDGGALVVVEPMADQQANRRVRADTTALADSHARSA